MKILLDTHIFLWLITNDARLPDHYASAIRDPANEPLLSVVSFWEIIVKQDLGRLPPPRVTCYVHPRPAPPSQNRHP